MVLSFFDGGDSYADTRTALKVKPGQEADERKGEGAGWGFAKQAQLPFSWKTSKQTKRRIRFPENLWHFLQARLTPSSCW